MIDLDAVSLLVDHPTVDRVLVDRRRIVAFTKYRGPHRRRAQIIVLYVNRMYRCATGEQ